MRKLLLIGLMVLALTLFLGACGGGDDSSSDTSADTGGASVANGQKLFEQTTIGSANAPGCVTCHSTQEGVVLVGPSQYGLATRAETEVPGLGAEEYIRQSILEPNAHIAPGFTADVMYQNYAQDLPAPQVDDLVAYLLTLK